MTAEIAIRNREAVALAADSAVTIQQGGAQKIWQSANKIFTLSSVEPVGIMFYGSADFADIPWEVIVKIYRKRLSTERFDSVKEYADNFFEFLRSNPEIGSKENLRKQSSRLINHYFEKIVSDIESKIKRALERKNRLSERDIKLIADKVIRDYTLEFRHAEPVAAASDEIRLELFNIWKTRIDKIIKKNFQNIPLPPDSEELLLQLVIDIQTKFPRNSGLPALCGIVIAGFGEKDIFPQIINYGLDTITENGLIKVQSTNFAGSQPHILAFAQNEPVRSFMEGVDPNLSRRAIFYFHRIIDDTITILLDKIPELSAQRKATIRRDSLGVISQFQEEYRFEMQNLSRKLFHGPILEVVGNLPKDEMANMAETLVSLTSFKRRISFDAETVSNPIDVAVISKGDGFIWIKRKHYFKPELNWQYDRNYRRSR